ncbi:hypothetical protein TMRH483_00967 [Qipengyuania sp. 483]
MATIREIKLTGSKSDGARLVCSVHGKLTDFGSGSLVVRVHQDACYNLLVVCEGKAGNEATVEIEAVHRDCKLVGFLRTVSPEPAVSKSSQPRSPRTR